MRRVRANTTKRAAGNAEHASGPRRPRRDVCGHPRINRAEVDGIEGQVCRDCGHGWVKVCEWGNAT